MQALRTQTSLAPAAGQSYTPSTTDKLSFETHYKLREFFTTIADMELQVERQRQRIVTCHREFEPFAVFQRLDRNGDARISAIEIYSYLRECEGSSLVSMRDCQMVIEYFDIDRDGSLSYQE